VRWLSRYELRITMALLIVLFVLAYYWPSIFLSIPAGHRGVLWSRIQGTYVERVYREGSHFILPWDVMTIYDVRYQTDDRTYTILSDDGLPIDIEVTTRYKPSEQQLGYLHARVGPAYAANVVIPEIAAALRAVIGNMRPDTLYGDTFEAIQNQVYDYAEPEIGMRHVILDDVLVRKITLPPAVIASIERKFQAEQAAAEMVYRISREQMEADRKVIEATGIQSYNRLVASTLTDLTLQYKGVEATLELARSNNAKVVVVGGANGLPLILNPDGAVVTAAPPR
jgi:regulator of protease activity HflC (stomatin/prohibitin superfamily)